ncbi:MHC class II antigen beta [Anopheles sinensis]|uniref:MHC class II antigen beta n=1 Tax=Anopheles sinensis TaxID=74873 RepID=A0A084VM74_ANOSI|nr:MHC class II antigen beta [Anopheles sinensis]
MHTHGDSRRKHGGTEQKTGPQTGGTETVIARQREIDLSGSERHVRTLHSTHRTNPPPTFRVLVGTHDGMPPWPERNEK